jgi:hypothetical protein
MAITTKIKTPVETQTIKSNTPSHQSKQKLSSTTKILSKSNLTVAP